MVDQNMSPNSNQNTGNNGGQNSESSPKAKTSATSEPSVIQAGQWMLIFALTIVFLVCCAISVHLYLRRTKRRRRKGVKKTKKDNKSNAVKGLQESELHGQEKKMAELTGTPLCEMGESEPRHEMEDAAVPERHTMDDIELQNPASNPVARPYDRDVEAGTFFGEMTTITPLQPEARIYAAYMARVA
jgi:hypothetical protein